MPAGSATAFQLKKFQALAAVAAAASGVMPAASTSGASGQPVTPPSWKYPTVSCSSTTVANTVALSATVDGAAGLPASAGSAVKANVDNERSTQRSERFVVFI